MKTHFIKWGVAPFAAMLATGLHRLVPLATDSTLFKEVDNLNPARSLDHREAWGGVGKEVRGGSVNNPDLVGLTTTARRALIASLATNTKLRDRIALGGGHAWAGS